MTDDIVTRLREGMPAECWGCGEWGCQNKNGETIPCFHLNDDELCDHDNKCECECHDWLTITHDAADEIERLRNIIIGIAMNKQVWKGFNFD